MNHFKPSRTDSTSGQAFPIYGFYCFFLSNTTLALPFLLSSNLYPASCSKRFIFIRALASFRRIDDFLRENKSNYKNYQIHRFIREKLIRKGMSLSVCS